MSELGPAKFAYVVVDSTRKHDPAVDVTHAPAAPAIGDVFVFPEDHGRAEYLREDDHGPIVDIVQMHFVAVCRQNEDGDLEFSYEAKRMLALLQIGARHERVLHEEIDRVFDRIETALGGFNGVLSDETVEQIRKEFA